MGQISAPSKQISQSCGTSDGLHWVIGNVPLPEVFIGLYESVRVIVEGRSGWDGGGLGQAVIRIAFPV